MWQKFDIVSIVHKEFVSQGQTVNGKFFCEVLRRLRSKHPAQMSRQVAQQLWAQHHDNAQAHASLIVQQFLASMNMTVIPHPPYLPDLTLCDFFLFPKIKLKRTWRHFDSIKEIQTVLQNVMKMLM
jgi:hypothetical protein